MQYQQFLNDECKVRFKFQTDKETKVMKWRDLTGPEKKRLFKHMDIPTLFPSLENTQKIQQLWNDFITLVNCLSVSTEQSPDKWSPHIFDKQWVTDFCINLPEQRCYTIYALSSNACIRVSRTIWKYWPVHTTIKG